MSDDAVELELLIPVDTENGVGIWTNEVECKGAIWSCECKFENDQLIAYVHCNKRNEEISNLDVWKYTAKHHFICRGEGGVLFTLVPVIGIKEYFSHDNEVTLLVCFREELEALDYDDDGQEQLCTIVAHIEDIKNIPVMSDHIALKLHIPADTANGTGIWTEEVECQGAEWSCEYKFENDELVGYVNCNTRHAEMPAWEYSAQHQFHIGFSKKSLPVNKYVGQLGIYFKTVNGEPLSANGFRAGSREAVIHFADDDGLCKVVAHIFDIKNHLRGNVLNPGDFILIQAQENLLGCGADASVYKGENKEVPVAIKKFHIQKTGNKDPYTEELERFIQLRHRNLVKMIGHVPKRRFILLELCQNGSLHKHIHDLTLEIDWQRLNAWINHIIEGMIYLHRNDVTHRDLKSDKDASTFQSSVQAYDLLSRGDVPMQ